MKRSYSFCLVLALGITTLLTGAGCKKADSAPAAAAAPSAAPTPAPAAAGGVTAAAPVTAVAAPAAPVPAAPAAAGADLDAGPAVVPGEVPPVPEAVAPPAAGALSDEVPKRREKTLQTICTRTCNKSQICGTGGESVADCFERCLQVLQAEGTAEGRTVAAGVRAKDSCADGPCTAFAACADVAAPREYAYLAAPPISPKLARERCGPICEAQKECAAAPETPLPPGEDTCSATCEVVMVSIDLRVAEERQRLLSVFDCKETPCDGRDACVKAKTTPPAAAAEPSAPPAPVP